METTNREVFDNIRLREHIIFPEELSNVMAQFDALYASSYKEGIIEHLRGSKYHNKIYGFLWYE